MAAFLARWHTAVETKSLDLLNDLVSVSTEHHCWREVESVLVTVRPSVTVHLDQALRSFSRCEATCVRDLPRGTLPVECEQLAEDVIFRAPVYWKQRQGRPIVAIILSTYVPRKHLIQE